MQDPSGAGKGQKHARLPRAALREVLWVYAGVTLATVALSRLRTLPGAREYVHLAVALLFLTVALRLAQREPDGLTRYGLGLGGLLSDPAGAPTGAGAAVADLARSVARGLPEAFRESAVAIAIAAAVFPPFALGFYLWHGPAHPFTLHRPDDLAGYLLGQVLVVGLPEEALFRGYFQTRLQEHFRDRVRVWGATISIRALVLQALLFGAMHFAVDLALVRLAVFFPALVFGWLRAWRGGVGAAVVFHALCNLYSDLLVRGWL